MAASNECIKLGETPLIVDTLSALSVGIDIVIGFLFFKIVDLVLIELNLITVLFIYIPEGVTHTRGQFKSKINLLIFFRYSLKSLTTGCIEYKTLYIIFTRTPQFLPVINLVYPSFIYLPGIDIYNFLNLKIFFASNTSWRSSFKDDTEKP